MIQPDTQALMQRDMAAWRAEHDRVYAAIAEALETTLDPRTIHSLLDGFIWYGWTRPNGERHLALTGLYSLPKKKRA